MTMTHIQTTTLGTSAASIEFTFIPQNYTDLVMLISHRNSGTTSGDLDMRLNGSTTNGTYRVLGGTGTNFFTGTGTASGATFVGAGTDNRTGNTPNTFSNVQVYICNYSSSSTKNYSSDSVSERNNAEAYQIITGGTWTGTAAVTSITIIPQIIQNLDAGSSVSLYGIAKGSDGIVTTTP
jgi:hypothetical protein